MKTIEIVVHCWQYHRELTYQLSSLALHPPKKIQPVVTVVCCIEDRLTINTLDFFADKIDVRPLIVERDSLFNRGVGRNEAAKATKADLVWFADADYVFGEGCLDTLAELEMTHNTIYFPETVLFQRNNVREYVNAISVPSVVPINESDFHPLKMIVAIGGIQIVTGETARTKGYCDGHRDLKQRRSEWVKRCRSTRTDVVFRRMMGHDNQIPIDLPNVFRLKQSRKRR